MWIPVLIVLYVFTQQCLGIYLIELPNKDEQRSYHLPSSENQRTAHLQPHPPVNNALKQSNYRRDRRQDKDSTSKPTTDKPKEAKVKDKIKILVKHTLQDTKDKLRLVNFIKDKYKDDPGYKIGFLLSRVRKNKDNLDELFDVSVTHRDDWMVLDQVKTFELVVASNVETTDLVRQMFEIHAKNLASKTNSLL